MAKKIAPAGLRLWLMNRRADAWLDLRSDEREEIVSAQLRNWRPPNTMTVHIVSTGRTLHFPIPPAELAKRRAMDKRKRKRRR